MVGGLNYLAPSSLFKHLIAWSNRAAPGSDELAKFKFGRLSSIFSTKFDPFGKMHTQQISKSCLADRAGRQPLCYLSRPFHGAKILNSHQPLYFQIYPNFHSEMQSQMQKKIWIAGKGFFNLIKENGNCANFTISDISIQIGSICNVWLHLGWQTWQHPRWAQLDQQGHRWGQRPKTDFSSFSASLVIFSFNSCSLSWEPLRLATIAATAKKAALINCKKKFLSKSQIPIKRYSCSWGLCTVLILFDG